MVSFGGVMIQMPHDMILISIQRSRYDMYLDTYLNTVRCKRDIMSSIKADLLSGVPCRTCSLSRLSTYYCNCHCMLRTAQLGGPILKAFGRVQKTPFQLADKFPMITDQHTAGGWVTQLSQLAKLSHWLTLSTKDITTSFWHYSKLFFLCLRL